MLVNYVWGEHCGIARLNEVQKKFHFIEVKKRGDKRTKATNKSSCNWPPLIFLALEAMNQHEKKKLYPSLVYYRLGKNTFSATCLYISENYAKYIYKNPA